LLIDAGATIGLLDDQKNNPIHICAREGHKEILKLMLEHNPEADTKNLQNNTPLDLAKNDKIRQIIQNYLNETKYTFYQVKIHKSSDRLNKNLIGEFNQCVPTNEKVNLPTK